MVGQSTKLVNCSVCGLPTPHIFLQEKLEKDTSGREFSRMACRECGAHSDVYEDQGGQAVQNQVEGDQPSS